ncbi:stage II sporulation protein M [Paenibacillus sp. J5C_2022]|nr:stage II sporulation protein M [Paenibacillus sp. J5C2022]MCU6710108.1 stage II sporulation protein M [Paenibacillus sp. J5C2022]
MKYHYNLYVFVTVLFLAGAIFGVLVVHLLTLEQQQDLAGEISRYIQLLDGGNGLDLEQSDYFWSRLLFHLKWLVLVYMLGITVIGIPGVLALNFLKGVVVGFTIGTFVLQYAWQGLFFSLVAVMPHNIILIPAMIVVSAAAISFAMFLVKNRLLRQEGALLPQLGSYSSTAVLMLLLFAGAALFEAYMAPSLIQWASGFLTSSDGII